MLVQDVGEEQIQQAAFFYFMSIYYPLLLDRDPLAAEAFQKKHLTPEDMVRLAQLPYSFLHFRMCICLPSRLLAPIKDKLIEWAPLGDDRFLHRALKVLAELDEPACIALMNDLILDPRLGGREVCIVSAVRYLKDENAVALLRQWAAHFAVDASAAFDEVITQAWRLDMTETVQWVLELLARETGSEDAELFDALSDILELMPGSSDEWSPMGLFLEDGDNHTAPLQACFPFTIPINRLRAIYHNETVNPLEELEHCFQSLNNPTPKQRMAHAILQASREWDAHSDSCEFFTQWVIELIGFNGPPNWDQLHQATPDQLCDLLDNDLVLEAMIKKMASILKGDERVLDRFKQYIAKEEDPTIAWLDILEEMALPQAAPLLEGLIERNGLELRRIMSVLESLGWEDLLSSEDNPLNGTSVEDYEEEREYRLKMVLQMIAAPTISMSPIFIGLLLASPDRAYLNALEKRFLENESTIPWERNGLALVLSGLNRFFGVEDHPDLARHVHDALLQGGAMLDFSGGPPVYLQLPLACDQCSAIHDYRVHDVLIPDDGMGLSNTMIAMEEFQCLTCGGWTQLLLPEAAVPRVLEEWEATDYRASKVLNFNDENNIVWESFPKLLSKVGENPKSVQPRLALASLYMLHRHFGKAKDILQHVVRCNPLATEGYFLLGESLLKESQWKKAYEVLLKGGQTAAVMNWPHTDHRFRREYHDLMVEAATSSGNPLPAFLETMKGPIKKIGRNEPCPCESGLKYKKCCGRRN